MPVYRYKAYDVEGKVRKGTVDEDSKRAAMAKLRQQKLVPINVKAETSSEPGGGEARSWMPRRKASLQDVAMFTRQLSTLVTAGLPLVEALTTAIETADQGPMRSVAASVRDRVNEGTSMAEALRKSGNTFTDLYINMVAAGEESGTLEIVLERLADFLDGQLELRSQLVGAMAYPLVMLVAMLGVIGILFVFVIPKITQVFDQTGQELPLPTQILIALTDFTRNNGGLLAIALVALAFLARYLINTPRGRDVWDRVKVKAPIFGPLNERLALSRFARTLATLLSSGVSLPVSLKIVRAVVGNKIFAEAVDQVHDVVVEGGGLARPLEQTGVFPRAMVRMVAAGERSGELEDMLGRVATAYDRELQSRLVVAMRLLEPILIILMAGLVFFIMLSILIPMFKINQLVGS